MPRITNRVPFSPQNPYRQVRPTTSKIIFLSLEGGATEHEYFERISELFDQIKYRLQLISVTEDVFHTKPQIRTPEQNKTISSVRPLQLVNRIEQFKKDYDYIYDFSQHPDDEFWIVTDVDQNWSEQWMAEWNEAIQKCKDLKYQYVISNPFFEIWLLLHHDEPSEEDKSFAVIEGNEYQPTDHFRVRLRELGAPLKEKKHIHKTDYTLENVEIATSRAARLHLDKKDRSPHYFATTVYLLLEQLIDPRKGKILEEQHKKGCSKSEIPEIDSL